MTLLQARAGDCRITVTRRGTTPARTEVDPQLVRQVFWNLALNAAEAMPRGGAKNLAATRWVKPRFVSLRKATLDDLHMDDTPHIFWE